MPDAAPKKPRELHCPSAPANAPDAKVFGVIVGSHDAPRVAYLEEPTPFTEETAALAEGLDPGEVFRVTSRCFESGCVHYQSSRCSLGDEIHSRAPSVESLPPCSIRAQCRWFAEQGPSVCLRCPAVVTSKPSASAKPGDKTFKRLKLV